MQGFKDFLLRGNLIELAVAFIIGGAFASVVTEFTALLIAIISKIFDGPPKVDDITIGDVPFGPFFNATISFVFLAAIIYFAVVLPVQKFNDRKKVEEPEAVKSTEQLLGEIRDLLAGAAPTQGSTTPTPPVS